MISAAANIFTTAGGSRARVRIAGKERKRSVSEEARQGGYGLSDVNSPNHYSPGPIHFLDGNPCFNNAIGKLYSSDCLSNRFRMVQSDPYFLVTFIVV